MPSKSSGEIEVVVTTKRNCCGDLEVWARVGAKWLPCGIARIGRLDDVNEIHQRIRTMKRREEMKIDAKMGVVIERPESVLPVEVRLESKGLGRVCLQVKEASGHWLSIAELTENGLSANWVGKDRLGDLGLAVLASGSLERIKIEGLVG